MINFPVITANSVGNNLWKFCEEILNRIENDICSAGVFFIAAHCIVSHHRHRSIRPIVVHHSKGIISTNTQYVSETAKTQHLENCEMLTEGCRIRTLDLGPEGNRWPWTTFNRRYASMPSSLTFTLRIANTFFELSGNSRWKADCCQLHRQGTLLSVNRKSIIYASSCTCMLNHGLGLDKWVLNELVRSSQWLTHLFHAGPRPGCVSCTVISLVTRDCTRGLSTRSLSVVDVGSVEYKNIKFWLSKATINTRHRCKHAAPQILITFAAWP